MFTNIIAQSSNNTNRRNINATRPNSYTSNYSTISPTVNKSPTQNNHQNPVVVSGTSHNQNVNTNLNSTYSTAGDISDSLENNADEIKRHGKKTSSALTNLVIVIVGAGVGTSLTLYLGSKMISKNITKAVHTSYALKNIGAVFSREDVPQPTPLSRILESKPDFQYKQIPTAFVQGEIQTLFDRTFGLHSGNIYLSMPGTGKSYILPITTLFFPMIFRACLEDNDMTKYLPKPLVSAMLDSTPFMGYVKYNSFDDEKLNKKFHDTVNKWAATNRNDILVCKNSTITSSGNNDIGLRIIFDDVKPGKNTFESMLDYADPNVAQTRKISIVIVGNSLQENVPEGIIRRLPKHDISPSVNQQDTYDQLVQSLDDKANTRSIGAFASDLIKQENIHELFSKSAIAILQEQIHFDSDSATGKAQELFSKYANKLMSVPKNSHFYLPISPALNITDAENIPKKIKEKIKEIKEDKKLKELFKDKEKLPSDENMVKIVQIFSSVPMGLVNIINSMTNDNEKLNFLQNKLPLYFCDKVPEKEEGDDRAIAANVVDAIFPKISSKIGNIHEEFNPDLLKNFLTNVAEKCLLFLQNLEQNKWKTNITDPIIIKVKKMITDFDATTQSKRYKPNNIGLLMLKTNSSKQNMGKKFTELLQQHINKT